MPSWRTQKSPGLQGCNWRHETSVYPLDFRNSYQPQSRLPRSRLRLCRGPGTWGSPGCSQEIRARCAGTSRLQSAQNVRYSCCLVTLWLHYSPLKFFVVLRCLAWDSCVLSPAAPARVVLVVRSSLSSPRPPEPRPRPAPGWASPPPSPACPRWTVRPRTQRTLLTWQSVSWASPLAAQCRGCPRPRCCR